jgi:TrkA domain protein
VAEVRETRLPGVGVRHDFTADDGTQIGVLVHRDGRRDVLVYDRDDPDSCSSVVHLSADDARTVSELLGASQITEAVTAMQQQIEGLALEWIEIPPGSPMAGRTIGDGAFRTRTGCSVVAVIRGDTSFPAPGPDFAFEARDVAVVVGTLAGVGSVRSVIDPRS